MPDRLSLFVVLLSLLALQACAVDSRQARTEDEPENRMVIQISGGDPLAQGHALTNVSNVLRHYGEDNVVIEVVAFGDGLAVVTTDSEHEQRVEVLLMQGVRFTACGNTMRGIENSTGRVPELIEGVGVVTTGLARIMELQKRGYAYIRP